MFISLLNLLTNLNTHARTDAVRHVTGIKRAKTGVWIYRDRC